MHLAKIKHCMIWPRIFKLSQIFSLRPKSKPDMNQQSVNHLFILHSNLKVLNMFKIAFSHSFFLFIFVRVSNTCQQKYFPLLLIGISLWLICYYVCIYFLCFCLFNYPPIYFQEMEWILVKISLCMVQSILFSYMLFCIYLIKLQQHQLQRYSNMEEANSTGTAVLRYLCLQLPIPPSGDFLCRVCMFSAGTEENECMFGNAFFLKLETVVKASLHE